MLRNSLVILFLTCQFCFGQNPNLRSAFESKPIEIRRPTMLTMTQLHGAFTRATKGKHVAKELLQKNRNQVEDQNSSVDDLFLKPRLEGHLTVTSAKIEAAPVDSGIVLLRISGEIETDLNDDQLHPLAFQHDGQFFWPPTVGRVFSVDGKQNKEFAVYFILEMEANKAAIAFVKTDGTWLTYQDRRETNPANQFVVFKTDKESLLKLTNQ